MQIRTIVGHGRRLSSLGASDVLLLASRFDTNVSAVSADQAIRGRVQGHNR